MVRLVSCFLNMFLCFVLLSYTVYIVFLQFPVLVSVGHCLHCVSLLGSDWGFRRSAHDPNPSMDAAAVMVA